MYSRDVIRENAYAVIHHYLNTSYQIFGQWVPRSMGDLRFRPHPFVLTTLLTMNKRTEIDNSGWSAKDLYELGKQIIFENCLKIEGDMAKVTDYYPCVLENKLYECYIRCLWAVDYQYSSVEDKQLFIWFELPFYSLFDTVECADEFKKKVQDLFSNDLEEDREELINTIVGEYNQFLDKNASVVWRAVGQPTSKSEITDMVDQVKQTAYSLMNSRGIEDA